MKKASKHVFHASPGIITDLRPEPMWFSFSRKTSEAYFDFSKGELKYVHEYMLTGGDFMSIEEVKDWCVSNDVDYDSMEAEIRDNPDDLMKVEGVEGIASKCDGFTHYDHNPEGGDDIVALIVFDPSKNLELVNINNVEDDREEKKKDGAMTDAGVVMGKKASLSESILKEYMLSLLEDVDKIYNKGDMRELFGSPDSISWRQDAARVKALLYLYDFQTEDEQHSNTTHHHNKMGFNGTDAGLLSSFAQQIINRKFLSDKQMALLRRKIVKYAGQIARVANEVKTAGKDQLIQRQFDDWVNNNVGKYQK